MLVYSQAKHTEAEVGDFSLGAFVSGLTNRRFRFNVLCWIPAQYHGAIRRRDVKTLIRPEVSAAISIGIANAMADLAALHAATNAAMLGLSTQGPVLYFPAGLYPADSVEWDPRVSLEGEHAATTRLFFAALFTKTVGANGDPAFLPAPVVDRALFNVRWSAALGPPPSHSPTTLSLRRLDLAGSARLPMEGSVARLPWVRDLIHIEIPVSRFLLLDCGFASVPRHAVRVDKGVRHFIADRIRTDGIGGHVIYSVPTEPNTVLSLRRFTSDTNVTLEVAERTLMLAEVAKREGLDTVADPSTRPVFGRAIVGLVGPKRAAVFVGQGRVEVKTLLVPGVEGAATSTAKLRGPPAMVAVDNSDGSAATVTLTDVTAIESLPDASIIQAQGLAWVRSTTDAVRIIAENARLSAAGSFSHVDVPTLAASRGVPATTPTYVDTGAHPAVGAVVLGGTRVMTAAREQNLDQGLRMVRHGDVIFLGDRLAPGESPARIAASVGPESSSSAAHNGFLGASVPSPIVGALISAGVASWELAIDVAKSNVGGQSWFENLPVGRVVTLMSTGLRGGRQQVVVTRVQASRGRVHLRPLAKAATMPASPVSLSAVRPHWQHSKES